MLSYLPPLPSVVRKGQELVFIKCLVDDRLFTHTLEGSSPFSSSEAVIFILQRSKLKLKECGLL